MPHQLTADTDRVQLKQTHAPTVCAWTDAPIPADTHAVVLRAGTALSQTTRSVWLRVGAVDDARATLTSASLSDDPPSRRNARHISPSGSVRYHELTSNQCRDCAVCGELCRRNRPVFTWYQPRRNRPRPKTKVRVHPDCRDRLADALARTWEHGPALLADTV